jgi:hypothetical protein
MHALICPGRPLHLPTRTFTQFICASNSSLLLMRIASSVIPSRTVFRVKNKDEKCIKRVPLCVPVGLGAHLYSVPWAPSPIARLTLFLWGLTLKCGAPLVASEAHSHGTSSWNTGVSPLKHRGSPCSAEGSP